MHDQRPPLGRRKPRRYDPTTRSGRTSWIRAGAVLTAGFLLWLVMDAVVLQHNATVIAPLGARRTAALDILDPLTQLARWTGLAAPVEGANVALGRLSDGGFAPPTVPSTTTTTDRPGTTTTTTTIPQPTARHPLRILLVGDSIGEDLDGPLLNDLAATGVVRVFTDDQIDTGLTRLDYFPWIAELESDVYRDRPDVIVGMMGANDAQGFVTPTPIAYGTAAWKARYRRNVGQFFTIGAQGQRRMFWVSVPIIANTGLSRSWQLVRDIQREEARLHHVTYIDSDLTLDPGGAFHAYLKVGGQLVAVRTVADGVHLTPAGGQLLAAAVMADLQRDLHLRLR